MRKVFKPVCLMVIVTLVLALGTLVLPAGVLANGECDPLAVRVTASATMGEAPLAVQFRSFSDSECITTWDWSFGDGGSSGSRSPSHTYQNEGTYTATCTVTDDCEDTASAYIEIRVEAGTTPPILVVRDLYIDPIYAEARQAVGITAKVYNEGGAWGSADIQCLINGYFEGERGVGVAPGTYQHVSFTVYKTEAREYQVIIGDAMGTFFVMEEDQQAGSTNYGPLGTNGIIAIVVIGIILVGGVIMIFIFSRPS